MGGFNSTIQDKTNGVRIDCYGNVVAPMEF